MGSLSQSKEEQIYFLVRMLFSISAIVLSMSLSVLAEGEVLETNRPRNARLFMVSSSSTTSTVSTTTYCYVSGTTAITTACGKRKRSLEAVEDIVSSSVVESLDDVEGDTEVMSGESEPSQRDPRFLLYWMTTTSTSTLTSFTATTSIGTLECTPSSFTISACG